jgi:hypothetical protein
MKRMRTVKVMLLWTRIVTKFGAICALLGVKELAQRLGILQTEGGSFENSVFGLCFRYTKFQHKWTLNNCFMEFIPG